MNIITTISIITAALVLTLSACGSTKTLSQVPETTEATEYTITVPETTQPKVSHWNDRMLTADEYEALVATITREGYSVVDRATYEGLGESVCNLAEQTATQDQLIDDLYRVAIETGIDPGEFGFTIGALMTFMCQDEYDRLAA